MNKTQEKRERSEAQQRFRDAKVKQLADEFRRIINEVESPEDIRRRGPPGS